MSTYTAKERKIRTACLARNIRLASLIPGSNVSASLFYRVVRGEQTSGPVDRYLESALNITLAPRTASIPKKDIPA